MLPVVQTFVAFPAGIARMPRLRFHIYTLLGSWPWCFCLAYVGMKLGEAWHTDPRFHEAFHRFHLVVELALLARIRMVCVVAREARKASEGSVRSAGRTAANFEEANTVSVATE